MSGVIRTLKRYVYHDCGQHGIVLAEIRKRNDKGGIEAKYCCGWLSTNYHVPTLYELLDKDFTLIPKGQVERSKEAAGDV